MAKKIYLTSLKGGTGTTTCSVGLGFALAAAGERTLIVDGDALCADALDCAKIARRNAYTLADAEQGACRFKQTICEHPRALNLCVMPTLGCKDQRTAARAIAEVEGLFDYIICDGCAPEACDTAIVVTEPYSSSVNSAEKCVNLVRDCGFKDVKIIVNKVNGGLVFDGEIMFPQEIASLLHAELAAVIPEDFLLPLGRQKKNTIKAFALAADKISGKGDGVYGVVREYYGLGGLIKRKMRTKL